MNDAKQAQDGSKSPGTMEYFESLESRLDRAMEIAALARKRGLDPSSSVEIPQAKDLAERVEKLVGIPGVASRIREYDQEGLNREEAALAIGLDFALGRLGASSNKLDSVESAIRTAVALLTEGVVAAPIEGIARVGLGKNDDGTDYLKIYYAGPIRSAGGTAQALSVLVADYVRRRVGIAPYRARPEEVERYVEEIAMYKRAASLQYTPSDREIRTIVENCPICIDGEPTEDEEVSGFRDLQRIETNRLRGGMALVSAEGIALKRPKLMKQVAKLGIKGWEWLDTLDSGSKLAEDSEEKFLRDLIAGRPVFSHPSRPGGFRLRYGRSRNTGLAAAGVNPATMVILGQFLAAGTQIKVEQPGKAAAVAPVSTIEGPTLRLTNGDVVRIDAIEDVIPMERISEIIDLGEILVSFGDFLENNKPLAPSSYSIEWWAAELKGAGGDPSGLSQISGRVAIEISRKYGVPLHPAHTYLWHDLTYEEFEDLARVVSSEGELKDGVELNYEVQPKELANRSDGKSGASAPQVGQLILPLSIKRTLEKLLVLHVVKDGRILINDPLPLLLCLGIDPVGLKRGWDKMDCSPLEAANILSGITVRAKAPTRIGCRMGRPEKSDRREMKPPPHVLFPVGDLGGRSRSIKDAAKQQKGNESGIIEVEVGRRVCKACGNETYASGCDCGEPTILKRTCQKCKAAAVEERCPRCGTETTIVIDKRKIKLREVYTEALKRLGEREPDTLRGVLGLTSRDRTPEPLEKGILRAKHGIYVFKDGTVRYDLTDLPLTHFRPLEIGTDIERLRDLGYTLDIHGEDLTRPDQICELKVQDVILSYDCGEYLLRVARFVDDLLMKFYELGPYYNALSPKDLIGVLLIALAPHTSAGVLSRLIGYTRASAGYGHPFFHAAKRRNCDGDEDCVMLLMDALLNFSRSYLPEKRGGKMDAPLVLTTRIDPLEVDSEAHNLDISREYPLQFYEATLARKNPKELESLIDLVSKRLGRAAQYEGFAFTHDTSDIAAGPKNSAYKTLGTMIEKMDAQLDLARVIRAVDEKDVALRVINSHFLPDLIGNLRAFSRQKVRCVKCGARYRRPLLTEVCPKCGGRLVLTVHEGSVRKYLEVSMRVAKEFEVESYTRQRLEAISMEIETFFKSEKSKQTGLADFM